MTENRIVVAIDSQEKHRAIDLAKNISDEIFAIKVNWPLILEEGHSIISKLSAFSKVICDFKVADIPNTNRLIAEKVHKDGAFAIIAHSVVGEDSLRAISQVSDDLKLISVVSMSHPGAESFLNPLSDKLIENARKVNSYGLIAPGNNTKFISHIKALDTGMKIFSPGIGVQGGDPVDAIVAGTDYVIIGRSIYLAEKPQDVVADINGKITAALKNIPMS